MRVTIDNLSMIIEKNRDVYQVFTGVTKVEYPQLPNSNSQMISGLFPIGELEWNRQLKMWKFTTDVNEELKKREQQISDHLIEHEKK